MFKDEAIINVKAGNGGNGCVSFHREKFIQKGGPDGGDGGDGGNVILQADTNCNTLFEISRKREYAAKRGEDGKTSNRKGKNGKDITLRVPPGTQVRNEAGEILVDLKEKHNQFVVAKGGKGGFGNAHYASPVNQVPRSADFGANGEELKLHLELKLIADVGLVGFPNAGKSTLISRVSKAKPKIADYPFTTLEPQLGIVSLPNFKSFVMADIPGIIEGAHEGVGLGDKFLRHIERTRVLMYVIDIAPLDKKDPYEMFTILQKELKNYSKLLSEREFVVVANKMDLTEADENYKKLCSKLDIPVYPISAVTGKGLNELLTAVTKIL